VETAAVILPMSEQMELQILAAVVVEEVEMVVQVL
jgi:hypothetical protein